MGKKTSSHVSTKAGLSRDGRYLYTLDDAEVLSVYSITQTPNASARTAGNVLWKAATVRCGIWHSDESIILILKKNGSLEWKSLCNDPLSNQNGFIPVDHLLRLLVAKKLEFDCLNSINLLAYQRNYLIIQTSARQIVALELLTDSVASVAWAYSLSEFQLFEVCDRCFLVFEPLCRQLSIYSLFTEKLKKKIDIVFPQPGSDHHVFKLSSSPNGKHFAVLGTQLYLGNETKLESTDLNTQHLSNMFLGDENIALVQEQSPEYLLYNYTSKQVVYKYSMQFGETLLLRQHLNHFDQILKSTSIYELKPTPNTVTRVNRYEYGSMLSHTLTSQHFESCANILKLAVNGSQTDLCRILEILNEHILANFKNKYTPILQKVIGAGLRFACQAYQKFPDCSKILEFVFSWQDILLNHHQGTPVISRKELIPVIVELDDEQITARLRNAVIQNRLPIDQYCILEKGKSGYQSFDKIREIILDQLVETINVSQMDDFDHAAVLIRNLGRCSDSAWEYLIVKLDNFSTRRKLIDSLVQRDACNSRLGEFLDFLELIEKHDSSVPASRSLKAEALKRWESGEHHSFLAEVYLQEKDSDFIGRLRPREVWLVMLKRQIISGLRKWIETQASAEASTQVLPYCWPIDDEMINLVADSCNKETSEAVLNMLALRGIITSAERRELPKFIARILKILQWTALEVILEERNSNVSCEEFINMILDYCRHQRRPGLLWDVLNHIPVLIQDDFPTWMKFVIELNSKRTHLSTSAVQEILSMNCFFLQEERILCSRKFPALTTGAILSACVQGVYDRDAFSFFIPKQSSYMKEDFENKTIPGVSFLKRVAGNLHFSQPYAEQNKPFSDWFLLVIHRRPVEAYRRILEVNGVCEHTTFCLKAAYSYAIAKKNDALRGLALLLIRMCKIENIPPSSSRGNHQSSGKENCRNVEKASKSERRSNDENDAVSRDINLDGTTEIFEISARTINELLDNLLLVHEEQPDDFKFRELLMDGQRSESAQSFLSSFLTEQHSNNSNLSHVLTHQSIRTAFTKPVSDLFALSDSKQKTELVCLRVVTEYAQSLTSLYIYIAIRLPEPMERYEVEVTVNTVCDAMLRAMESNKFDVVVEAFNVIAPDQLLTSVLNWLNSYSRIATLKEENEELLDKIVRSTGNRGEQQTFPIFCKLFHPSLLLLSWLCKYVVREVNNQLQLLMGLARATTTFPILQEVFPNLAHLTILVTTCIEFKINIRTSILLCEDSNNEEFKHECEKVIKVLLRGKEFNRALEVAKACGLPIDSILVTQLSSNLPRLLRSVQNSVRSRNAFWRLCSSFFNDHRVRPEVASTFFLNSSKHAANSHEKHCIIDHSLNWARKMSQSNARDEDLAVKLDVLWWETKIEADIDEKHPVVEELADSPRARKFCLLRAKLEEAAAPFSRYSCSNYSSRIMNEVVNLIGLKLDNEDLFEAFKLSAIFKIKTNDLSLILLMLSLVENPLEHERLLEEAKEQVPLDVSVINAKDLFNRLESIAGSVRYGRCICDRILVFYHVAVALDMSYAYVVNHKQPLCILKMLVEHSVSSNLKFIPGLGGLFNLASRWAAAANIGSCEIVAFVKDELIETVRCAQSKISDTEASMVVSLLQGTFNRWVTLCKELTQLGTVLLASSSELQRNGEWATAVEILIFAHSSFTLACNVENIRQILNQARYFIDELAAEKNWALITRLLTGLQRYAEMNYVFTMLKEADQFEYFLRKGMDRLPLLRQALLDFLRPSSSENRELFRLVALHFHMHAEVATLWKEEANLLVEPVIRQAHGTVLPARRQSSTPLKHSSSLLRQSSLENSQKLSPMLIPKVSADHETKNKLSAAMHDLAHAAEYYVQAGKLEHANDCVLLAELYALQLSMINSSKSDKEAVCVLDLSPLQVNHLIEQSLTYREAEILGRSYGINIPWGRTLLYHYVIKGETEYLNQFKRRQALTSVIVEEMLITFQSEVDLTTENPEWFDRFAIILSAVPDVELSYRIGSRLSLVPLVTNILSSPSLSYLKDKVWGSV